MFNKYSDENLKKMVVRMNDLSKANGRCDIASELDWRIFITRSEAIDQMFESVVDAYLDGRSKHFIKINDSGEYELV